MKNINKANIYQVLMGVFMVLGAALVVLLILWAGNCFGTAGATQVEQEPVVKYVEVIPEQNFDTSIIEEAWCGGFEDGTIRMVGAWYYAEGVVEDEQGQLWGIDQQVDETDFLLLWIADNNTPNNTVDDVVIKVWREAY